MRALLSLLGCLLIVIWLELGYLSQGITMAIAQLISLAVIILICLALTFLIKWAFRRNTLWNTPSGRLTGDRPSRRYTADLRKTDEEAKLEAMNDAELHGLIDKYPRYALAIEILCERLKARGAWSEYVRQMDYMLCLPNDLSIEETCNRYYELADIYIHELNRPDRAEEMIRAIIAAFPAHYEATEARRRLAEMARRREESDRVE